MKKLLSKWETGDPYRFKIFYNEINVINVKNENDKLKGHKRQLEESLVQETAKILRVKEMLTTALEKAEKKGSYYKKMLKNWPRKLSEMRRKKEGAQRKRNKFNDYTKRQGTGV